MCPAGPGQPFSVVPPRAVGGNVDIRQLVAGSTVYLPIEVEGAWFGAGDGHARQGDGEVCGSAVETESRGRLRLTLRRDLRLTSPAFESPPDPIAASRIFATTGVEPDLMRGAQNAVRRMIEWLSARYRITPEEAYLLSSVVVDLRISEVVDPPNWVVSACFPLTSSRPLAELAPQWRREPQEVAIGVGDPEVSGLPWPVLDRLARRRRRARAPARRAPSMSSTSIETSTPVPRGQRSMSGVK